MSLVRSFALLWLVTFALAGPAAAPAPGVYAAFAQTQAEPAHTSYDRDTPRSRNRTPVGSSAIRVYDTSTKVSRAQTAATAFRRAPKGVTRNFPAPSAGHPRLQNAYRELFREQDRIPGGTAGAIRESGDHIEKGRGYVKNLDRILQKERLSDDDFFTGIRVRNDLYDALKSRGQGGGLERYVQNP